MFYYLLKPMPLNTNEASQHEEACQRDQVSQDDDVLLRVKVEHADTSQHNEEACQRDVSLRVKVEDADTSQHNEASQHEAACQGEDVLLRVKVEPDDADVAGTGMPRGSSVISHTHPDVRDVGTRASHRRKGHVSMPSLEFASFVFR